MWEDVFLPSLSLLHHSRSKSATKRRKLSDVFVFLLSVTALIFFQLYSKKTSLICVCLSLLYRMTVKWPVPEVCLDPQCRASDTRTQVATDTNGLLAQSGLNRQKKTGTQNQPRTESATPEWAGEEKTKCRQNNMGERNQNNKKCSTKSGRKTESTHRERKNTTMMELAWRYKQSGSGVRPERCSWAGAISAVMGIRGLIAPCSAWPHPRCRHRRTREEKTKQNRKMTPHDNDFMYWVNQLPLAVFFLDKSILWDYCQLTKTSDFSKKIMWSIPPWPYSME